MSDDVESQKDLAQQHPAATAERPIDDTVVRSGRWTYMGTVDANAPQWVRDAMAEGRIQTTDTALLKVKTTAPGMWFVEIGDDIVAGPGSLSIERPPGLAPRRASMD